MTTMKPNWQSQFSLPKQLAKLDLFSYIKKKNSDFVFQLKSQTFTQVNIVAMVYQLTGDCIYNYVF